MKNILITLIVLSLTAFTSTAFSADEVISSGSLQADFKSWGKPSVEGDWKITTANGKTYIELADNFKAKKAPDLKFFLSKKKASDVTGKNATEDAVFVKLISEYKGSAKIEVPEGVDASTFNTLILHCEEYSKLWGVSPL